MLVEAEVELVLEVEVGVEIEVEAELEVEANFGLVVDVEPEVGVGVEDGSLLRVKTELLPEVDSTAEVEAKDVKLGDKAFVEAPVNAGIAPDEVAVATFAAKCSHLALFGIFRYIVVVEKSLEVGDHKIEAAMAAVGSAV